jgi:hypothetical protein
MAKKTTHCVLVTVRMYIETKGDVKVSDVISEMDYEFTSKTDGAEITETEIRDHEETENK